MKQMAAPAMFASGVVLYGVTLHVGGYLAAIAVPKAYFEWFGSNTPLALTLLHALTFALPIFVLATAWASLSLRMLRTRHWHAALWCVAGVVSAWLGWAVAGLAQFAATASAQPLPWTALAMTIFVPPIWGVLDVAAPPAGVLFAGWFAVRSGRSVEPARGAAAR